MNRPVTLDLNGHVAIRGRGGDSGPSAWLILNRSSYTGAPVSESLDRTFLLRAVDLGFDELAVADPSTPIVCRRPDRTYAWQPLYPAPAPAAAPDATLIDSRHQSSECSEAPSPRRTMIDPITPVGREAPDRDAHPASASGLAELIREVEGVHAQVAAARASLARLIAGLRRLRSSRGCWPTR
ncbi:hypothetical protein OJF2_05620 [Aquisphaera giovannonii]|uniref:Uncharacterized protein n=1 Tax=Aquisphaera giovannonii TaxID=406548 RepID=A0A5B9VUM9_9BACT|nr:hypothetical protein [Aquisphaera giovannonii]QEH32093.1 hypothetical protein OJF2_05620 [Aquisphaera giovannonii]